MSQGLSEPRRRTPRRAARIALLVVAIVVLAVAGVLLAVIAVPPALANLSTRVEPTDTRADIGRASVSVPAGWATRRSPLRPEALLLTSPDGRLDVSVSETAAAPDQALEDVAVGSTDRIQERLASGLTAVHVRTADHAIAAAVGDEGGSAVLMATADGDIRPYEHELAEMLESTRVADAAPEVSP